MESSTIFRNSCIPHPHPLKYCASLSRSSVQTFSADFLRINPIDTTMLAGLKGSRSLIGCNTMPALRRLIYFLDSPVPPPSLFPPSCRSNLPFLRFSCRPIRRCSSSSSPPSSSPFKDEEWEHKASPAEEWFRTDTEDEEWYRVQAEDEEWFRREEEFYEARISEIEEGGKQPQEAQPDYLALSESALFTQCRMDTFRASGPGGQHRNKTDSGVRLTHLPTGVVAQAVEDRSQHKNRAIAMNRLRFLIACRVRRPLKLSGYKPPPEVLRLLPTETGKKIGDKIGINHPDYPKAVQALLDLLAASQGYVFYAATLLRVSPAAFSKVLTSDKILLQATNELLVSKGQKPFK